MDDSHVKKPGNLPVMTEAELAAEDEARKKCIEDCITRNQARAVGADVITQDCENECMQSHPIRQVEVVSEPLSLPDP